MRNKKSKRICKTPGCNSENCYAKGLCRVCYIREYNKTPKRREYGREYFKRCEKTPEQKKHRSEYQNEYQKKRRRNDPVYLRKSRKSVSKSIRRRLKNDPTFRILFSLRRRLLFAIKDNRKSSGTLELVGCSASEFRNYFESLFAEGMTMKAFMNGRIHIDHIIPCASFDLSKAEEQRKCFHYSNLQPLWAGDNLKKGAKLCQ